MQVSHDGVKPIRHYSDSMQFSATNLLGFQEETTFLAFPFIGENSSGKVVLGAHVAPLQEPENFQQVVMAGTASILSAYRAIKLCCDTDYGLFRMRVNEADGMSITFDELIVILESEDYERYQCIGDLADDFRYSRNEFIEAVDMCRKMLLPVEELLAFGSHQTYKELHAQLIPPE